ncbi:acyl carrier protein [bacterium]|nr:acyl carrier protein [bacterium]
MTREEIRQAVVDIIEELAPDEDVSNLDNAVRIREQIELDSMDFLDIIMELRKQYSVQVPEDDYPKLGTLDGCMDYLEPLMKDK